MQNKKLLEETLKSFETLHKSVGEKFKTGADLIKLRLQSQLAQSINYLASLLGVEGIETQSADEAKPLTRMFGKDIFPQQVINEAPAGTEPAKNADKIKNETAEEQQAKELSDAVEKLFPIFSDIEDTAILDTYTELEIRGVGKRAGLPVTETSPKNVDVKFIGQIKEAIAKAKEIEQKGAAGTEPAKNADKK